MTLRWTDEQLEAHRKRMGGAKGSQVSVGKVVPMPAPKSKFSNIKTGKHASKKESKRAAELRLMEKAGTIRNLQEQVRYELIPANYGPFGVGACWERACFYYADFVYEEQAKNKEWKIVVEDCKGYRTDVYRIKRKLMLFRHGIRIKET